jgi:hypothetical protein
MACILDVPSSSSSALSTRQRLGQSIGRKRLLKNADPKHVIHPSFDTQMAITSVNFLNETNILSADSQGQIAVHRLPVGSSDIHKVLELPPLQDHLALVNLCPLSDGTSFGVGLPNGDYRIYSVEEGRWSSSGTALTHSSPSPSYRGYQMYGARRRYHRDFQNSMWSCLVDGSSHCYTSPSSHWSEISDWENKRCMTRPNSYQWLENIDSLPGRYPSTQDGWAFRETASTLHSAFVDPERDCFSVMDHRVPGPVLCYSNKSRPCQEDITACCFISDNALATSHVWRATSDKHPSNSIRIWDLRKMNEKPAVQHVLPSFPYDSIRNVERATEWFVSGDEQNTLVGPSSQTNASSNHQYITKLSPSRDLNNTLVITLQLADRRTELVIYDYIHNKVTFQQTCDEDSPVVAAVTPNHDFVATSSILAGAKTKISFFDPHHKTTTTTTTKSRKRPATTTVPRPAAALVGCFSPELEDRLGIRTRLTSLSWNATGTSLVGGSLDGDLFVWEGDE